MSKKAYFIGIAGKTMCQLAKAFKDLGWEVLGSDHKGVYPPDSTYLRQNIIPYVEGYDEKNVPKDTDLVIVSRPALLFDRKNPEYIKVKKTPNLPVFSFPEILRKYLIKDNSIVIVGTYGKTTLSALIAWILINAGIDPSYMTGGIPLNMEDGVKMTNSTYSVVEGDETPSLFETDPPKFMFFKPKYLLITATKWDHPEVYKSKEVYLKAFVDLVRLLPKDGLLVYNLDNVSEIVLKEAKCKKVSYSLQNPKSDYFIKSYRHQRESIFFELNKNSFRSETLLLGKTNLENVCGALAMSLEIGVDKQMVTRAVKSFKGVKTRLEFLGEYSGRYFYWDIAQHPQKVKGSLEALREHYLKNRIICVFDPTTTGLKYKESLKWYLGAFDSADMVIVGKVGYLKVARGEKRVGGMDIVKEVGKTNKNVFYQPIDDKIAEYLTKETQVGDVIVFMSSGGLRFTNLIEKIVDSFKKID